PVYAYRLAGFDKEWNEIGQRREATYTALPPGTFNLEVKVRYAGGQEAIRQLSIVVAPPIWRTWWAYTLYALLILLVLGAIWYFQYLSHRLAIEATSRQKEQQFYSLRNQLFTYISHELRTPLTLIMGSLEPLKSKAREWNKPSRERLQFIDRHTHRLIRLVNQLMDFRRLEENVLELNPQRVDLGNLVGQSVQAFEVNASDKRLGFRLKIPAMPTYVLGDAEKLEQILYNLLSNATKYAPEGGDIQVHLTSCHKNAKTTLRVWNAGPGLAPETLESLFQPFVRGTGNHPQPGSGIGLAFTRALVELHGGDIRLESAPGAGVAALVRLPCAAAQTETSIRIERPAVDHSPQALPVLLVADDQPDIRGLIQREYQQDFQILPASNGLEALEIAYQEQPDIILLDVRMPGGPDGISVCQQLKQSADTRHIPVIMLSAQDTAADQVAGLEHGADEYVTKPFSIEVLRALLKSQLRNRQLVREQTMQQLLLGQEVPASSPQVHPESEPDPFLTEIMHLVQAHLSDPTFGVDQLLAHMPYGKSHLY
ncbi:MAG: ATP-binding protein, partial [Bacteroidota bacterium]